MKNLFFLALAVAIVAISWGLYQLMGQWLVMIFLIATFLLMLKRLKPPKFSSKRDQL